MEALSKAAKDMGEVDEDGCAMREIQELIERFESLQKNISEKREFFQRVTGKWHKFAEQKHKMNAFFKNTHGIVTKRYVKNANDCKKQIEECEVANAPCINVKVQIRSAVVGLRANSRNPVTRRELAPKTN